jgi:hypothetical protein
LRAKSQPALVAVVEECGGIDCVGPRPETYSGLRVSIDKLTARREVETALHVRLADRPANIAGDFNAASTDLIDRLEEMSNVFGDKVRTGDAETAELIEIKQLGWLARDAIGLERNALSEALNAKVISPARGCFSPGVAWWPSAQLRTLASNSDFILNIRWTRVLSVFATHSPTHPPRQRDGRLPRVLSEHGPVQGYQQRVGSCLQRAHRRDGHGWVAEYCGPIRTPT